MSEGTRWTYDTQQYFNTTTIGSYTLRVWQTMVGKWTAVVIDDDRVQTRGGFLTREQAQTWAESMVPEKST